MVSTRLAAKAGPKFVERVGCITTPGEAIDAVQPAAAMLSLRGDFVAAAGALCARR